MPHPRSLKNFLLLQTNVSLILINIVNESYANSTNLEQYKHRINDNKMQQHFNNLPAGSSKHAHLNTNEDDVNHNEKHQIRPNCFSRNDYDTDNIATMSENEVITTIFTNKYNKYSCREISKCPFIDFCKYKFYI